MDRGAPLPKWYLDEPDLVGWQWWFMQAFWDLSTERPLGWSPGPIPWSKIREYACVYGLDSDMIEPFIRTIRVMDAAYLEWVGRQQANKKNG